MSERVTMPALGESVTEGTVTRWLKNVGDSVAVDEPLLEVSTDKVDTEIPSPVAGTLLEIQVAEDETVPVGADLAVIRRARRPIHPDTGGRISPPWNRHNRRLALRPGRGCPSQLRARLQKAPAKPPAEAPAESPSPSHPPEKRRLPTPPSGCRLWASR